MTQPGEPTDDALQPLAALISRQASDVEVYAGFLYSTLAESMPAGMVQIERKTSMSDRLRGREGTVVGTSLRLGEQRFILQRKAIGAPSQAMIAHEVGGIVLSRTEVSLADWSQALTRALAQLAQHNAGLAHTLQRLSGFTV